ncbi:hypothetical protein UlMin_004198 [Ulmus minor]
MGSPKMLSGFMEILREAFKIFLTNGKLIPLITLVYLFLTSVLLFSNIFSIKPVLTDFVVKFSILLLSPSSLDVSNSLMLPMKYDLRIFAATEWIFILANSFTSLLFVIATILSAAATYGGKELDLKGLVKIIGQTWKRPLITLFFTTLLDFGYVFFVSAFVLPFVLIFDRQRTMSFFSILVFILVAILYLYLAVVWTLALVVSVLEEKSGVEALEKARELVKGTRLKGFLLKVLFGILYYVMLQLFGWMMISNQESLSLNLVLALVVVNFLCLVKTFSLIAYTVFYYKCKKMNEEEEFGKEDINMGYNKIAANGKPPVNEDLP